MIYWTQKGESNTQDTINAAVKRMQELNIRHVVVASNSGSTALKLDGYGLEVVCVTHHVGFSAPGIDEMSKGSRKELEGKGFKLLTTTHLLAGVDRAIRNKFQGVYPAEIIASALRILGQGYKVCVEISSMALDAGLIPHGAEIMTIGGSGKGADTACVVLPAHSNHFFDTQVKEIICMPREK